MKLLDFIKDAVIPVVSVVTAVMVAVLNYQVSSNEQALRERDLLLEERLAEIDLLVKQSQEQRQERESNQSFNIKIYDIVTQSLEEGNAQKQAAAKAFVIVMVDEPLRSSLLNVLKQGGNSELKADIGRILEQEQRFQSKSASKLVAQQNVVPSYKWGEWDFDIFWCSASGPAAKAQAELIGKQLLAEQARGRVRVRELPESINAKSGYQVDGYAIRRNSNEEVTALALKALAESALQNTDANNANFRLGLTRQSTPWYISVFVCPVN